MQNKLQELTDKLYKDGLSKGQEEGKAILSKAEKESEKIIKEAEKKAAAIIDNAKKQAEDIRHKTESDIKMASSQSIQATKQEIEKLVIGKISSKEIEKAMAAPKFLQGIITAVAEKFSTENAGDLSLVLPESLQKELKPFVEKELTSVLKASVDVKYDKKIKGGFTIGPKDGSYFISMTDETFKSLISEYLRPTTRKFLFSE